MLVLDEKDFEDEDILSISDGDDADEDDDITFDDSYFDELFEESKRLTDERAFMGSFVPDEGNEE